MTAEYSIVIVSGLAELAEEFADRMEPPFSPRDAASPAERSVLSHVRMAYINNDQIPIPAGTSAEGGVAHVLENATKEVRLVKRTNTQKLFVGAKSLWAASAALSAPHNSPFLLIEEENDWDIGVFELNQDEIGPLLSDSVEERESIFSALSADYPNAVVVTFSHETTEEDDEIEDAYASSMREMAAEQLKSDEQDVAGRAE